MYLKTRIPQLSILRQVSWVTNGIRSQITKSFAPSIRKSQSVRRPRLGDRAPLASLVGDGARLRPSNPKTPTYSKTLMLSHRGPTVSRVGSRPLFH